MDVAIIGGGIGGLSCACILRYYGFEPTIYEQAPQLGEVGAGLGIAPNGLRVYEKVGLRPGVEEVSARYGSGSRYHHADGTYVGEMTTEDSSGKYYTLGVHRADLMSILETSLPSESIKVGHRLRKVSQDDGVVKLEFENGSAAQADVVIGADGIHSVVREHVTRPSTPVNSGSIAYRGVVPTDRLGAWPENVARLWMGEGKHFLTYPVRRGQLMNYVGFVPSSTVVKESWSAKGNVEQLRQEFIGWDDTITNLLGQVEETFWWGLYDRDPLENWTMGRVTLLGDAAHAMLPHLGQGANQAIEDAVTLAVFLKHFGMQDVGQALEQYERLRLQRTTEVQLGARKNGLRYDSLYDDLAQRDVEIKNSRDFRLWLYDYDAEAAAKEFLNSLS